MMRRENSPGSGCTSPCGPNHSRLEIHSTTAATSHHAQRACNTRCTRRPIPASSHSAATIPTANQEAYAGGQIWELT